MSGLKYYILDIETTGITLNYNEITEISFIRCDDKVQTSMNLRCDYPERASYEALTMTNKTMESLKYGISKKEAIDKCNVYLNDDGLTPDHRCIIGHNVQFDRKFMHALWKMYNVQFPANLWLDTLALSREYIKINGLPKQSLKLHAACDMMGIKKIASIHNAKSDTRNTFYLWDKLSKVPNLDIISKIKNIPHVSKEDVVNETEDDF